MKEEKILLCEVIIFSALCTTSLISSEMSPNLTIPPGMFSPMSPSSCPSRRYDKPACLSTVSALSV